ncbi:MAG: UDP-N-acetylglucosamine 1-carboxyvinyltransferase [Alphaproteobacteria bacterium]|nr:UDP-N-acetylglucosamine 1-carboxyvinyltransferase [Alphaproteobacteria bacterium]
MSEPYIRVRGGVSLTGSTVVSGAKNAALPLLAATALQESPVILRNVPRLRDVHAMITLMESYGASCEWQAEPLDVAHSGVAASPHRDAAASSSSASSTIGAVPSTLRVHHDYRSPSAPQWEAASQTRTGILILGAHLARFGKGLASLPGGCPIGERPIDLHIQGLRALGAEITISGGYVHGVAKTGLRPADIHLRFPSVGATEHLMIAACGAFPAHDPNSSAPPLTTTTTSPEASVTTIRNAAREPEIVNLAALLNAMGFVIEGAGTHCIRVHGRCLHGENTKTATSSIAADATKTAATAVTEVAVIPDRIEAGTLLLAGLMTRGDIRLDRVATSSLDKPILDLLSQAGTIEDEQMLHPTGASRAGVDHRIRYRVTEAGFRSIGGTTLTTAPWPGFSTDLQAQVMATLSVAGAKDAPSRIVETIFENRFQHAAELRRLGARITVSHATADIEGGATLIGADVDATDIRASACLVLAGLVAEGETRVHGLHHLDRGYDNLHRKLAALGADIARLD